MNSTLKKALDLISRPPNERNKNEISILLPWLRRRGNCLKNLDSSKEHISFLIIIFFFEIYI